MQTFTQFEGKHSDITGKVLGAFYTVYNTLGFGFNEKVYENAMVIELNKQGLHAEPQVPIPVYYANHLVGNYIVDMIVNQLVIIELKASKVIHPEFESQLLNYLKASVIEVGMLLNFGIKAEFRRKVFDNQKKGDFSWTKPGLIE
jgi:GxxExxY protein